MSIHDMIRHEDECYEQMSKPGQKSDLADGYVVSYGGRATERWYSGLGYEYQNTHCVVGEKLLMKDDGRPYEYKYRNC